MSIEHINVPKKRVFIGVRIPPHIASEILGVNEAIEPFFEGRFTPIENLHVTLKFIGSIDERMIRQVDEALAEVLFEHIEARIDGFGSFSNRIVWARITGLKHVQRAVDEALLPLFDPEERFMSHLTIARIKRCTNRAGLRSMLKALHLPLNWRFTSIELIESKSEARYETIASYPLTSRILI